MGFEVIGTCTLVRSSFLIFAFSVARIVEFISASAHECFYPVLVSRIPNDNMDKIVLYAPLECLPLMSPNEIQVRLFGEEYPFLTFGIAPKTKR